jgi:diguanylate cyclase (GGDEF)-like protein
VTLLTKKQVVFRIAAIIALVEFAIMLLLTVLPLRLSAIAEAALDGVLLVLLAAPLIYVSVVRPFVHARDEVLAQISRLAFTDPLTQLANRRPIAKYLGAVIAGSARRQSYGALLVLDLDHFKPINDRYGHEAGDAVLVEVARRLQAATRAEDIAGRLGGDEFVLVVSHLGSDERAARDNVLQIAEHLIRAVSAPIVFNGSSLQVGVSIGIRLLGPDGVDTEAAINQADDAMYRAKQAGGGRAVLFDNHRR